MAGVQVPASTLVKFVVVSVPHFEYFLKKTTIPNSDSICNAQTHSVGFYDKALKSALPYIILSVGLNRAADSDLFL